MGLSGSVENLDEYENHDVVGEYEQADATVVWWQPGRLDVKSLFWSIFRPTSADPTA
jgi:hypothetical protein